MFLKKMTLPVILLPMEKRLYIFSLLFLSLSFNISAQPVTFTAQSTTVSCETNSFSIDVVVDNFTDITSFQFSMHWDSTLLQLNSITNKAIPFNDGPGPSPQADTWTFSYFAIPGGTLSNGTTLYTMNFTGLGIAGVSSVFFDGTPTPIEISQGGSLLDPSGYIFNTGTVTITDTVDPVITCPGDVTADTGGASSVQVSGIPPNATDNCAIDSVEYILTGVTSGSGNGDVSNSVNFNIGVTTVQYIAHDYGGNTDTCSFNVTVTNITPPSTELSVYVDNVLVNCENNMVSVDVLADNFSNFVGAQFTLTWNTSFLQYIDTSNIVFTSNAVFGINDVSNGVLTFSWFDISNPVTLSNGQVLFTINFTVSGNAGFTIPISFINSPTAIEFTSAGPPIAAIPSPIDSVINGSVYIFDNVPPSITCPADVTVNSINGTDAIVNNIAPTTSDNCGILDTTYVFTGATTGSGTGDASGSTFNVGTTNVQYTITDYDGNSTNCNFNIDVIIPGVVTFYIDSLEVNCTESTVTVNFPIENFTDMRGVQFSVQWDTSLLQYITFSNVVFPSGFAFGESQVTDGILSFVWFGTTPTTLMDGESLFSIEFNLNNPDVGDFSNVIFLTSGPPVPVVIVSQTSLPGSLPPSQYDLINGNVLIVDNTPPTITCPGDVTVNSGGSPTAIINNIPPIVMDDCAIADTTWALTGVTTASGTGDASGTAFNAGTTLVTYTATDEGGNSVSCSFNVTVVQEVVEITCPSNTSQNIDPGLCSAIVNNLDVTVITNPANVADTTYNLTGATTGTGTGTLSGMAFNVGTTIAEYIVTDIFGGADTCTFQIDILDTEPPVIACPPDITANAIPSVPNGCGNNVSWATPSALDNCDPNVQITCTHLSGSFFPVGTTVVTCYVVDNSINLDSCKFNVTVIDNVPPVLAGCPGDIFIDAAANCSAIANWIAPTATDNCDNMVNITSTHNPGDTFMAGTTMVTYTAEDNEGNTSSCTFNVTVNDNEPPTIFCPANVSISTNGMINDPNLFITGINILSCDSVILNFDLPLGADNCLGWNITQTGGLTSGDTFLIGTSVLEFTNTDASLNTTTCEVDIIVNPFAAFFIDAIPDTVCQGESVQLVAEEIAGATYSWTGPNPGRVIPDVFNPVIDNTVPADSGNYIVVISDSASNCEAELTVSIVVHEGPQITATVPGSLDCTDGTADLILEGNNVGNVSVSSWQWTDPSGMVIDNQQNTTIPMANEADAGFYILEAVGTNGCTATDTVEVIITDMIAAPIITQSCDGFICDTDVCTLNGVFSGVDVDTFYWSANPSAGAGLPANLNQPSIPISNPDPGAYTYTFTVESDGCVASANTLLVVGFIPNANNDFFETEINTTLSNFNVINNDSVPPNFTIGIQLDVANGSLENHGDGTFTYIPEDGFIGVDQFTYTLCISCNNQDICDFGVVNLEVNVEGCLVPTVITPNGDGFNDTWIISCVEENPRNQLIVYNRWGDEVYRASPYNNDWNGTYNDQDLPDGVYFYVFKEDESDTEARKGTLNIIR